MLATVPTNCLITGPQIPNSNIYNLLTNAFFLQRRDEDVLIALTKPIEEIKSEIKRQMAPSVPDTPVQPAEDPTAPSSDKGEQTLS